MRNQTIAALALIGAVIASPASAQRTGGGMSHGGFQGGAPSSSMPSQPHWNGNGGGQPHWNGNGGQPHWNGNGGGGWNGGGHPGGGSRWGGRTNGRWSAGWNAPGGWNGYRRPSRGWRLPSYWFTPSYFISDYGLYGLAPPPYGYNWSRYYDDAVLVDGSGRVRDYVGGLDWDQYDNGYDNGYGDDDGYQGQGGYGAGAPYPPPAGGPGYDGPPPTAGGVTTYSSGGGYYASGYYYPPAVTTTVTIQQAPSVTTTTTEYVETTRTRYVARKAWKPKRTWHPRPRIDCGCGGS